MSYDKDEITEMKPFTSFKCDLSIRCGGGQHCFFQALNVDLQPHVFVWIFFVISITD